MCCDPECGIGSEYVTYHKLTDSDESLSAVMAKYAESSIVGLIIINTTNSTILNNDFVNNTRDVPSTPPVYIVSSGDGEQLIKLVTSHEEGNVQIKVFMESALDYMPAPVASIRRSSTVSS